MRALITGGTGFVGVHLANHLVSCRDDVVVTSIDKEKSSSALEKARVGQLHPQVQNIQLDVTQVDQLRNVLEVMQPDVIYHLAGISFAPQAEGSENQVFEVNMGGTRNVLQQASEICPGARVLFVSSSAAYGMPRAGALPFVESSELRPYSVYGASKASTEPLAISYALREQLSVVVARPFTHVGPFQEERFSLSGFAKQFASMKLGLTLPVLSVGNLEVKRDFSDVADIVRGYREAAHNGKSGEVYNFCSGESYDLSDLVQKLREISGMDVSIEVDEDRFRPVDVPDHYGSYDKAFKDFGWKPRIDIDSTLNSLFSFWLEFLESQRV